MVYGVIKLVFASLAVFEGIFLTIFTLIYNSDHIVPLLEPLPLIIIVLQLAVAAASGITAGLLAIKYSVYIKKVSQKFQTEAVPQQTQPESAFTQPVVTYNEPDVQPAPIAAAPVSENPYEPVQAPTAQAEIPQAPVREDYNPHAAVAEQPAYEPPVQEVPEVKEYPAVQPAPVVEQAPAVEEVKETPAVEEEPVKEAPVTTDNEKPVVKFCTQCGKPVGPNDYFCNNCGTEIIRDL